MSDRERLIEAIKKSWDKQNMTFDDIAQEIEAAGWVLPKPEAEDHETAFSLVDAECVPGGIIHDAVTHSGRAEFVERIAAALSAVRAQMQAKHAETIGALASVHRSYQDMHARATAAEAALERARAFAKRMRKARDLQGPAEYRNDPKAMKIWQRALYHEGKELDEILRAALEPPPCK